MNDMIYSMMNFQVNFILDDFRKLIIVNLVLSDRMKNLLLYVFMHWYISSCGLLHSGDMRRCLFIKTYTIL